MIPQCHYITPAPTFLCPAGESCLTLSTLAANISHHIESNTTLIFLAGNHTLDMDFTVTDMNEFQMLSLNDSVTAHIFCSHNTHLIFTRIVKMQISGLKLIGCLSRIEFIDWFRLEDSSIHGASGDSSALYILKTSADIVKSNFTFNRAGHSSRGILFLNFYDSKFMGNIRSGSGTRVGGAVFIDSSNVGISYSHFGDNAAQMGGAIFSQTGSNVTVSNCTFDHNSAIGCRSNRGCRVFLYGRCTGARCHGGALFIGSGCTLIATNSTFMSNTADITGGAIALFQGKIFDTSNEFYGNSVDRLELGMGGGIALYGGSTLTIDGSYYKGNTAFRGAVIFVYLHCSITVYNTVFDNNTSNRRGYGGVMHAFSSSIAVDNSFFYKNRAGQNGGVMYVESSVNITINNNYFANNEAASGGVVRVLYSIITMDNNVFEHNKATPTNGGVVSAFFSSITVRDSFFNNSLAGGNFGDGGALYASSKSNITVENSSFNNSMAHQGGVIYASPNCRITLKKSSFDNNQGNFGGVIYATAGTDISVDHAFFHKNKAHVNGAVMYTSYINSITIQHSSFDNNLADRDGGVMYMIAGSSNSIESNCDEAGSMYYYGTLFVKYYGIIILNNSFFSNNTADNYGGVMYAYRISSITVDNCSFDENTANNSGGVLYSCSSNSVTVNNSFFVQNTAANNGGVAHGYLTNSMTFKNRCKFLNSSANEGGAVYLHRTSLTDFGNTYYNNIAMTNGGAMALNRVVVAVAASNFVNNSAEINGGVMCAINSSNGDNITFKESTFHNNKALNGGGVIAILSNASLLTVIECTFTRNRASKGGAVYLPMKNNLTVESSNFTHNSASKDGGVFYSEAQNQMSISNSTLNFNVAEGYGGVFCSMSQSELIVAGNICIFNGNRAHSGGVVYVSESRVNIYSENLIVANNTAVETGGALHLITSNLHFLNERSRLVGNQARSGGTLYTTVSKVDIYSQNLLVANNSAAERGGAIQCSTSDINFYSNNNILIGNQAHSGGVLYASESQVNVYGHNLLMAKNTALDVGGAVHLSKAKLTFHNGTNTIMENEAHTSGGALFLIEGQLIFSNGDSTLVRNQADDGGAIYASESKVIIRKCSFANVTANSAMRDGGGLYLMESEMNIEGDTSYITRNRANRRGGGIHLANSVIILSEGVIINIMNNEAGNGGGVSLETNAQLSGTLEKNGSISFISNSASRRGGALYIDDETNPAMCEAITVQNATSLTECFSSSISITFLDNFARFSGSNIFGGLLDRCSVNGILSQDTEIEAIGLVSFLNSSNLIESQLDTVSSHPVRLCFCERGQPDCNYQPELIQINRGKQFSIELIAYDQVFNAVGAIIYSSIQDSQSSTGYLGDTHGIGSGCTDIQFSLLSAASDSVNSENLTLSMEGPCPVVGISERTVVIETTCACPIGFQTYSDYQTPCDCVCHTVLQAYKRTDCNASTESIIRRESFWITYINRSNSSGYIVYPNCPFDYCYPSEVEVSINLNLPNGSDAQCVSNRVGVLCGTCKLGYSVSLGSSQCLQCATNWPLLLVIVVILFIVSGIGLVTLLLALNLTVAIGSLNAIIFFANILAANRSALFPSDKISFASVFISWLNFDIGVNICFYNGMDTYIKTWLQLVFPAYIIILVVIVIKLSYHFTAFGRLVGRKDPVATLATLILLSYTKLVQTLITIFSSATLHYPDGPKPLWLPDATVEYFAGKHAALFFIAILILLLGSVYTFLLFLWQWFLLCPRNRVKWIINQKFSLFLETYHAPYTPKHRYWTGLLLLIRVSIYLIAIFNPSSGDPRVTLLSTIVIVSLLFFYLFMFGIRVYKHWSLNAMEALTYLNIIVTSIFTWYTFDTNGNQKLVTNTSVGITFAQLVVVIFYHGYKYTNQKLFNKFQSVICKRMKENLRSIAKNGSIDQVAMPTIDVPSIQSQPTYSVVEFSTELRLEYVESHPGGIDRVVEKGQSAAVENNQCSNHSFGIKTAEQFNSTGGPAIGYEHALLVKSNSCANSPMDSSMNACSSNRRRSY